eukprot:2664139-Pleurochrysis_carterae.AAC.1
MRNTGKKRLKEQAGLALKDEAAAHDDWDELAVVAIDGDDRREQWRMAPPRAVGEELPPHAGLCDAVGRQCLDDGAQLAPHAPAEVDERHARLEEGHQVRRVGDD